MPSHRVNRAGEIEIFVHRWKTGLAFACMVAFTAASIWALAADPRAWFGWAGLLLFGVGGAFYAYRNARLGLLRGRPALVLSADGLWDRASGVRVRWDELETMEYWEFHVRGTTQRFLGLEVRDPDAVRGRAGAVGSILGELVLPGRPALNLSLSGLAVSTEALVALIRRFWDGPIAGAPEGASGPRRSRLRRFLGWLGGWAITLALGIALVVVFVVVAEACRS